MGHGLGRSFLIAGMIDQYSTLVLFNLFNVAYTMSTLETMIRVSKRTREKLADIGSKRETYDTIIQRLLEGEPSS